METGFTKTAACKRAGISYAAFKGHIDQHPELLDLALNAEQMSQDILADKLVNIVDEYPDHNQAKVISENIKWLLARRRQKDYGDRMITEVNVTADKAILQALERSQERSQSLLSEEEKTAAIDVTYSEVVDHDGLSDHDRELLAEMLG